MLKTRPTIDIDIDVTRGKVTRKATIRGPLTVGGRSNGLYRLTRELNGEPKRNMLFSTPEEAVSVACTFCLNLPPVG